MGYLPKDSEISRERIATLSERQCNINESNRDKFVDIFIENAIYTGLLENIDDTHYKKIPIGETNEKGFEEIKDSNREERHNKLGTTEDAKSTSPEKSISVNININFDSSVTPETIIELIKRIKSL